MYNFKKNAKLYIVENGNKHSIEIYSDLSASQTFDEQSYKLKTLHNLNALHDGATITKANVANFSFTTPIHNVASGITPIVLTLGTSYSSGTISSFDIYIESDYVIYKIEKSVIEAMTFNIEKNSVLTVSISGTAAKISTYSTSALPVVIPGTPVVIGTKNYVAIKGLNVSISNTVLTAITAINIDIKNEVSWTDYNTMQGTLNNTIGYPTNYVVTGRTISGSVTQFITTENINTVSDISTSAPIVIDIYDSNTTVSSLLEFNLPSTVFTRRLNMEEIFNRVYDFRLNTNTNTSGITYKGQTLYLDFMSGLLDSRITFTRSSTATFVGNNGLIQTADINTPRFDYDPVTLAPNGLLIEEQRVNLVLYSDQFNNAPSWQNIFVTVTANTTTSPDGTANADTITADGTVNTHSMNASDAVGAKTISVFVKAGTGNFFQIAVGGTADPYANFNLSAATSAAFGTGTTASITAFNNGWYRCVMTTTNAAATGLRFAIVSSISSVRLEVFASSATILLWGAQSEAGAFATSYIPTVASTVTRAVDIVTMTGTNFSSWYNQSEGTIIPQFVAITNGVGSTGGSAFPFVYEIDSSAASNSNHQLILSAGYGPGWNEGTSILGVSQVSFQDAMTLGNANVRKIAYAYRTNDFAGCANGGTVLTDTSGTLPSPDRIGIGCQNANGGNSLTGYMRAFTYYPSRLTNAQLQALTA